jgi:hypothetical protein
MRFVQLSDDSLRVVTVYGGPQEITEDKPGYSEIADDDPRFLVWLEMNPASAEALPDIGVP